MGRVVDTILRLLETAAHQLTGVLPGLHAIVEERHEPPRPHQARRGPQQVYGKTVCLGQRAPHRSRKIVFETAHGQRYVRATEHGGMGGIQLLTI